MTTLPEAVIAEPPVKKPPETVEGDINRLPEVMVGVGTEIVAVVEVVVTAVVDGASFAESIEVLAPKIPLFVDELPPNMMPLLLPNRFPEFAKNEPGWELEPACLIPVILFC